MIGFDHEQNENQSRYVWCIHETLGYVQCEQRLYYHRVGRYPKVMKKLLEPRISLVVAASARYSTSVEEREIVCCFLDFHEFKESPRKAQKPVIDRQESEQGVQSASAKARNCKVKEAEAKT